MEFKIKQSVLKKELGFLQGIVEKKSTIPVLTNILIESVGENTLRFIGTDLDVTLRCEADAEIEQSGSICIQARKLFDIVKLLPDMDVRFKKLDNDWVSVTCGNSKYRLAGVNKAEYPEIPDFKSAPLSISSRVFEKFIETTSFAVTADQSRFALSGAKFIVDSGIARMVTTDGYRLAFIESKIEVAPDASIDTLIPRKSLSEIAKIARESQNVVSFGEDDNHIYFEIGGRLLTTRKLSGNFPNYEMVIPKDNDKELIFGSGEMKAAVDRIALMTDERSRRLVMQIREGEVEIKAESSEEGEGSEKVPVEYEGEEVTIAFNPQFLQEFLSNITSADFQAKEGEKEIDGEKVIVKEGGSKPRIVFKFKDSNGSTEMGFADETEFTYRYILMPLRA